MSGPANLLSGLVRPATTQGRVFRDVVAVWTVATLLVGFGASAIVAFPLRIAVAVAVVVGAAFVTYRVTVRALASLRELSESAKRFAQGDVAARAPSGDDEFGRIGRALNVIVDRQKVTVGQAKASSRKLENVLDSLPVEVSLFDAQGRLLYAKADSTTDGSDTRLAIGMTAAELHNRLGHGAAVGVEIDEAVGRCMEDDTRVRLEQSYTTPDGVREFTRVFTPVEAGRTDAVRVVAYGIDVTEQRRAQAQLRERDEQLLAAQKMEAIGRLAAGVAHDFNDLVGTILEHNDAALRDGDAPVSIQEHLQIVSSSAINAKVLTGQLLALGKQQDLRPEVVDLGLRVQEAEMMFRGMIGRHIRIDTETPSESIRVTVDPSKLEQVLLRLVLNARDAMSDGGRLTIRTRTIELMVRPPSSSGEFRPGSYAVVSVGDTGRGMDEASCARIFEPFSAPLKDGGGLGLSAVAGTVEQSGGFVNVSSEVGVGTTFGVYFPIAAKPVRSDDDVPAAAKVQS